MYEQIRTLLSQAELFGNLDQTTLDAVARVAQRRVVPSGEIVFREGDPGDFVFVLEAGVVEVTKRTEAGVEVALRELGVGEVGGLTSMSVEKRRSASLRARHTATLITVAKKDFLDLLSHHVELTQALIMFLSAKVRGKTRQVAALRAAIDGDQRPAIAFFDAKPYDRRSFDARVPADLRIEYFEVRLSPVTAPLARGCAVVCAFVNDDLSGPTIEQLAAGGTQLLALRCAGYNNVDLAAAARHGIPVVRVPAYSPHAVAEHAVALVLALNRKVHRAHNRVREGNFSLAGLVGFDLHGRTAGVVGLGKIGQCMARILRGFGMHVLAFDPFPQPGLATELGVRLVSLDDLLARASVVSLHAPLTPDTHHLIDAARFARMQRGTILVNTSRGGLIHSGALIDALKTGHLGAAGLDVYEEEGEYFFEDHSDQGIADDVLARLMTFPNVLITSHQGFLTEEALGNIAETTLANVREFLAAPPAQPLTNAILPAR